MEVKMPSEIIEIWNIAKEIIKDIAIYIMPIAAVLVSVIALIKSNKCTQVQVKLSEMEQKLQEYDLALKKYELEKIEREVNREKKACVEARIIKISQGKYKLKVWNSGDVTAYNIDVEIPSEYNIILIHHPENTHNPHFTEQQLQTSIQLLRDFVQTIV